MKSDDLVALLNQRYCAPAWAFLPQVRNGTGYATNARTADALAMSLWPSRGLHLYGFEIKISRQDLISELKNPEKAEDIAKYCDFWFLVVSDKKLIEGLAIPPNWGVLAPQGKRLITVKAEKKLDSAEPTRLFLAAILRKVVELKVPTAMLRAERELGASEAKAEVEERLNRQFKYEREDFEKLQKKVEEFELVSGVKVGSHWDEGKNIGAAVRQVLNGEHTRIHDSLIRLKTDAQEILTHIEKQLKIHEPSETAIEKV